MTELLKSGCPSAVRDSGIPRTARRPLIKSDASGNAEFAGVDNAGVDISARCGKGGLCRSGQCGTIWQGWTLREWTMQEWSNQQCG